MRKVNEDVESALPTLTSLFPRGRNGPSVALGPIEREIGSSCTKRSADLYTVITTHNKTTTTDLKVISIDFKIHWLFHNRMGFILYFL